MRKLAKLITLSAFTLQAQAFAQDAKSNFSEKNLLDNSPAKSQIIKPTDAPKENPIASTKNLANSIETLLLSKQPTSLMFDDEENSNIERAIDSFKNAGAIAAKTPGLDGIIDSQNDAAQSDKSRIYLGSILYLTPHDWAVWINNQKITSFTNSRNNEIYLRAVDKDKVKVVWMLSVTKWKILTGKQSAPQINAKGQVEIEFDLKPNQTYILLSGAITEGRISIQKNKAKTPADNSTPNSSTPTTPQNIVPVTTTIPPSEPVSDPAPGSAVTPASEPVSDNSNAVAAPLNIVKIN